MSFTHKMKCVLKLNEVQTKLDLHQVMISTSKWDHDKMFRDHCEGLVDRSYINWQKRKYQLIIFIITITSLQWMNIH